MVITLLHDSFNTAAKIEKYINLMSLLALTIPNILSSKIKQIGLVIRSCQHDTTCLVFPNMFVSFDGH